MYGQERLCTLTLTTYTTEEVERHIQLIISFPSGPSANCCPASAGKSTIPGHCRPNPAKNVKNCVILSGWLMLEMGHVECVCV